MDDCRILGSPNWYQSQVVSCSWDGKVAYGSKNCVFLIDTVNQVSYLAIPLAHKERIISLVFAPKEYGNCLITTGDDMLVRLWDLDQGRALLGNDYHQNQTRSGSVTADWSGADINRVVSVDEGNHVSCWNLKINATQNFTLKGLSMCAVSCCPHDSDLVAIGTKNGVVCILNVNGKGSIIHRLHGHDAEIVSLAWCPVPDNVIGLSKNVSPLLLASSARDRNIFIWRAGGDGFYEANFKIPSKALLKSGYRVQLPGNLPGGTPSSVGCWTALCWPKPDVIVANSQWSEILSYDLSKIKSKDNQNKSESWEVVHGGHQRGVFNIVCPPYDEKTVKSSEENWRSIATCDGTVIWSAAMDRMIISASLESKKIHSKRHTLGGQVHSLALSPIDGTSLAIGAADKWIRVWNLTDTSQQSMQTLFKQINAKVHSLAWHPTNERWLAYGTANGRVGIQDVLKEEAKLLPMFFKENVYVLQWGPAPRASSPQDQPSQYWLYAVGDGMAAAFDPSNNFKADKLTNILPSLKNSTGKSKLTRSELSWKPDFSILAIGNSDGSVNLLSNSSVDGLQLRATLLAHNSLIQDIGWHPERCSSDGENKSQYASWFATASNDCTIRVYDSVMLTTSQEDSVITLPLVATFKGHRDRVAKVSWNPHIAGQLVSASYDGCVQVWNVASEEPIACYVNHDGPLFACLWSPLDPDSIISAGADGTVRIWAISKQTEKLPNKKRSRTKKNETLKNVVLACGEGEASSEKGNSNNTNGVKTETVQLAVELNAKPNKKVQKEKSVFPVSGPLLHSENANCQLIQHLLQESDADPLTDVDNTSKNLPLHYGLFGSQQDLAHFMNVEHAANLENKSWDSALTLDVWRGNGQEAIAKAISENRLTDFHVSVASMVSHKTWIETCYAYAEQLKNYGEVIKASVYLVAIHKVMEAIKLLADRRQFRQAIVLAKSRLPEGDEVIESLLREWAVDISKSGFVSLAGVCYAAIGDWIEAARSVVSRNNAPRLLLASQLMAKAGSDERARIYAKGSLELYLLSSDWEGARQALNTRQDLKHLTLWALIHNAVHNLKSRNLKILDWFSGNGFDSPFKFSTKTENSFQGSDTNNSSIEENLVSSVLITDDLIVLKKDLVTDFLRDFEDVVRGKEKASWWLVASSKLCLAMGTAPHLFPQILPGVIYDQSEKSAEAEEQSLRYIIEAMSALHDGEVDSRDDKSSLELIHLCVWLAPQGPFDSNSVYTSLRLAPLQKSMRAYLGAALVNFLVHSGTTDSAVIQQVLYAVDQLKEDFLGLESMKYRATEMEIKTLSLQVAQKLASKQTVGKTEAELEDGVAKLSISKDFERENCEESNETGLELPSTDVTQLPPHQGDGINVEQLGKLKNWIEQFETKYVKVPNPYVIYFNLRVYLTQMLNEFHDEKAEAYAKSFQEHWEHVMSQL